MLRLPSFEYRAPKTVQEAARIVAGEGSKARFVAGGTDLWPNMKRRHQKAETVVSLMAIPQLDAIMDGNGDGMRLGGTTILDQVVRHPIVGSRYPALARAVASISSPPLRNMGTLGGNLCVDTRCTYYNQTEDWRRSISYCMKEEGETCWVAPGSKSCLAHTASDSAPVLCALDAEVELVSAEGSRIIPVHALFQNDGIHYLTKQADEILAQIHLPAASDAEHCKSIFWKLRRRGSIDFAVLSVAAAIWFSDSEAAGPDAPISRAEIYLGAVSSHPVRATAACEFLVGKRLTEEVIEETANLVRKPATPFDNTDFQAQWRGAMVSRYAMGALRELAGLESRTLPPRHPL